MSLYQQRGVSAQKEEVHAATQSLDPGLFPYSFCKLYPDYLGGDDQFVSVMHADGAGTKSILAYLYWKETGDLSVWKGIAQDAIVMNLDDLLCVGIYDSLVFNSTIDRNKHLIPGEVLSSIIQGSQELFEMLKEHGIHIHYLGGETADVGDVVRTIAVNGTLTARWPRKKVVHNSGIVAGDLIVGFAGFGKSTYENEYNSGIASNGLTSARHDLLQKEYGSRFPESFDPRTDANVVYIGPHKLQDLVEVNWRGEQLQIPVGKLLLSPTRTFAPMVKVMLEEYFETIHGMVHCSGGGQTKCMKYIPQGLSVIKDNLFDIPEIFKLIRKASGADLQEMYQVFNMGCRLEVFSTAEAAPSLIQLAESFGIDACITGRVVASPNRYLEIHSPEGIVKY